MVAAELHNPTRLRRLARRLWPGRPPYGDDDPRYLRRYGYSRREIADLIAAAMAEAAETAGGTIHRRGAGR